MGRVVIVFTVSLASVLVGTAGCNDGTDFLGFGLGDSKDGTSTNKDSDISAASACGEKSAPAETLGDPSTLPACSPACGGAHCVPANKVPEVSRAFFAKCGGGYCLPDPLIASGGAKPPSCKSLANSEGVCLGLCVPQVAENKDILPKSTCGDDERCAPCVNPNDGKDTGACAIGSQLPKSKGTSTCTSDTAGMSPGSAREAACPHVGPAVVDPTTLPACGAAGDGAHCLRANLTPAEMTSKLAACSGGFCVPDKLIAAGGRFIPKTCTSIGNAEGRCQSVVLPSVAALASQLPNAGCDANERCVPCTNPLDGTDTGACKTSCDPGPKTPPVIFPACCGSQGKCIPRANIPGGQADHLKGDGCPGGSLCVPKENLDPKFVAPRCEADGFLGFSYSGICVSNCVDFGTAGASGALDQGTCSAGHTCVDK
jgi:hypothetical protein